MLDAYVYTQAHMVLQSIIMSPEEYKVTKPFNDNSKKFSLQNVFGWLLELAQWGSSNNAGLPQSGKNF